MTASIGRYGAYRAAGLEWLEAIPVHWDLRRIKSLFVERIERGFPEEPLLAATQTKGVIRKDEYENRTVTALSDLEEMKFVRCGDFVISLRSFQGGIEYARDQGIISPAYTVFHCMDELDHGYFSWLFKSQPFVQNLSLFLTGIRQGQNVDFGRLERSRVPLPPRTDQDAIVTFLEHVDRRTQRTIHAKKKLIRLLEEVVLARTDEAMQHPGCVMARLENVAAQQRRPVERDEATDFVALGLRNRGRGIFHKPAAAGAELGDSTFSWVEAGDMVISGQFAWEGAVALASPLESRTIVSHRYYLLRSIEQRATTPYLWALFRSSLGSMLLDHHSRGAAGRNRPLNFRMLMKESIPIPPLFEQHSVDRLVEKIWPLRMRIEHTIELALEYRARLISEVATGQLDVRAAAARLPDELGGARSLDGSDVDELGELAQEDPEAVEA